VNVNGERAAAGPLGAGRALCLRLVPRHRSAAPQRPVSRAAAHREI